MVWEGWRREVSPYPDLRRIFLPATRPGEGRFTQPTTAAQAWRPELVFMPRTATAALPPAVATRSFKSIPMSRLGDGSCGDAFLDVGPACGN